ncbi:acyl-coenzyme A amino acid N-acyltransferase 2-like [Hyperolius riggenbachi]|uniref:acyl-coenzyme A amino acid N-acyltransferase 2-like n=1 Tax=Hyperolius riggenbachi TaxID=752182 RepID=UPI0035A376FE
MVLLTISPEVALADEQVKIRAWGLPPQQIITIRAWLKDERGKFFYSRAFYRSDEEGKVDLDHTPATGGDFHGVHPMGLFWALRCTTPFFRLIKRDVMESPFEIHLEVYCHLEMNVMPECSPEASTCLRRWYVAPGVQRVQVRKGRVRGALFLPPGDGPFRGVIDLFGGFGGLVEFRSSLLASRGFAALALAYFAYEDLPETYNSLDLTYFEEAIHFLSNHPKVSRGGVGLLGLSKGGEVALAMASYLPQVAATICINGTVAASGNTNYGDIFLPGISPMSERILFAHNGSYYAFYTYGDPTNPENEANMLPIEKATGPVLFLIGEKDKNYASLYFAKIAAARAEKHGKKDVYIECYPGAGHLLEPPCSPFCPEFRAASVAIPVMRGGELIAHCQAQEICWAKTQDFLRDNIPCSRENKL